MRARASGSKGGRDRGFALTAAAVIIALILIAMIPSARQLSAPMRGAPTRDPRISEQLLASAITGALSAAASGADPSNYISALQGVLGTSSANFSYSSAVPAPSGVLAKTANGTGGSPYSVTVAAPPGTVAVIADRLLAPVAIGEVPEGQTAAAIGVPPLIPSGYVIVYRQKFASYSGTVSYSSNYSLRILPPSITSSSWSAPAGFSQVLVYGSPQLSLVEVFDSSGARLGYSVQELDRPYAAVPCPGLPAAGSVSVRLPLGWLNTDIRSGDVYAFEG